MMSGRFLLRISLLALLGFHHCEAAPPEKGQHDSPDDEAGKNTGVKGKTFSETDANANKVIDAVANGVDGEPVPNPQADEAKEKKWSDGPLTVNDRKFTQEEVAKAHQKCEKLGGGNLNNDRKLTEVWKEMVECANGLVKMGQGLQTQLDDAHVAGMDYLKSYTGAYSTLTYLKGDDMLNALEKSHNNAIEAMDKEVDGVDDILKDIQPYTKYGHQKDDAPSARVANYDPRANYENEGAAEAREKAIEANRMAKEAEAARVKAEEDEKAARLQAQADANAERLAAEANKANMRAAELLSREQMAEKRAQVAKLAAEAAKKKAVEKLDQAKRAELAEAQTPGLSGSSRESSEERWEELSAQTPGLSGSSRESSEERSEEPSAITASTQSDQESPRKSDHGEAAEAARIQDKARQAVSAVQDAEEAEARATRKENELAKVVRKDEKEFGLKTLA